MWRGVDIRFCVLLAVGWFWVLFVCFGCVSPTVDIMYRSAVALIGCSAHLAYCEYRRGWLSR